MEFVMVPVPEEHVVEVMQYVTRLVTRASVLPWDDESVRAFFAEGDEASRSLLSLAARAMVANKQLSDDDASSSLELSNREIRAILRDLNERAMRDNREPLVTLRDAQVELRNGRTVDKRLFTMTEANARLLRAADRSEAEGSDATAADAES
jgi:hypothetical protein